MASALDVRQAEQLLFTATGQIASLEREIAQAENALSLLLGQVPGDVPRGRPLDALAGAAGVPAGLPSALLERRPDIRQAEQQLIAANAQIGAAKAEYFPRISLTGFFGAQSRALSDLLTGPAGLASASLGAAAPVFNAGRAPIQRSLRGGRAARGGRELSARDLHGFPRRVRRARGVHEDDRVARGAGTARRRARRVGATRDPAISGRARQLPARARRAAESV